MSIRVGQLDGYIGYQGLAESICDSFFVGAGEERVRSAAQRQTNPVAQRGQQRQREAAGKNTHKIVWISVLKLSAGECT